MKFARAFPVWVAASMLCATPHVSVAEDLPDASFNHWAGTLTVIDLPDGTEIYEYSAQTISGKPEGAVLSVSFVPRFRCVPVISVHVSGGDPGSSNDVDTTSVELTINGKTKTYLSFHDVEQGSDVYTIAASSSELIALRASLDASSSVSVHVLDEGAQNNSAGLVFSLFGSTLTTQATELYCKQHTSQDYSTISKAGSS